MESPPRALPHPVRYSLVALALGPVFYFGLALLPWTRGVVVDLWRLTSASPAEEVLAFSLTSLACVWILRHWIVTASTAGEALDAAIRGLALGSGLFLLVLFVGSCMWEGELPAAFRDGDWSGLCVVLVVMPVLGIGFALYSFPVSVPFAWLAVRVLRWAAMRRSDAMGLVVGRVD